MLRAIKRLFAAVLSLSFVFLVSGCSGSKVLTIGIENNALPLSGQNSDNEIDGYIVEMAREAAKRMGMQVEFKFVDFSKGEKNFSSQNVDALWGRLIETDSNKSKMYFTSGYLNENQILFVESGSVIESTDDLKDKTVGTVKGSEAEKALLSSTILTTIKDQKPVQYNESVNAKMQMDNDNVDALAINETYARNILTGHAEQYRILDGVLSNEVYAIAVRRNDSSLHDKFETALESMKDDGTAKNISIKWFGIDMTAYLK